MESSIFSAILLFFLIFSRKIIWICRSIFCQYRNQDYKSNWETKQTFSSSLLSPPPAFHSQSLKFVLYSHSIIPLNPEAAAHFISCPASRMAWGVRVGVRRLSRVVPTSLQRRYLPEMVSSSFVNDILAPGLLSVGCSTVIVWSSLPSSQITELSSAKEVKDFLKQKTLVVFPKLHPLKLKHLQQSPGWTLLPLEGQIFLLLTAAYCGARAALPQTQPNPRLCTAFPRALVPSLLRG